MLGILSARLFFFFFEHGFPALFANYANELLGRYVSTCLFVSEGFGFGNSRKLMLCGSKPPLMRKSEMEIFAFSAF